MFASLRVQHFASPVLFSSRRPELWFSLFQHNRELARAVLTPPSWDFRGYFPLGSHLEIHTLACIQKHQMEPISKPLFLELALPEGTEEPQSDSIFFDQFGHEQTLEFACEPRCDDIKLDSLLCLRLPTDYTGTPSLQQIEYCCKLASISQHFYRSISAKQWLRTAITSDMSNRHEATLANLEIHSNVVPREAYAKATCRNHVQCTRGFFRASEISGMNSATPFNSCGHCAFTETLNRFKTDCKADGELPTVLKFLILGMKEVKMLNDLAPDVYKVLWRKGVFVRKQFDHDGQIQNPSVSINRELDVALNVSHPNIVHYFGCSTWADSESKEGFLFMELLKEDLGTFLLEVARDDSLASSFSFRDRLDVLLQVAQAMQHLHEMNFVHGDLKPQNVFMSRFELAHSGVPYHLVKVGDFGCAQRVDPESGATVEPFYSGIGTLHYVAPEVFRCRKQRALVPKHPREIDVYSFGVVAYQVLTGTTHLYEDLRSGYIKEEVMSGRLRPDSDFKGTLDGDLLPYIRRCWAQEPEMRPSFAEICDTLLSIMKDRDHGLPENNDTPSVYRVVERGMKTTVNEKRSTTLQKHLIPPDIPMKCI